MLNQKQFTIFRIFLCDCHPERAWPTKGGRAQSKDPDIFPLPCSIREFSRTSS